MKKGAVLGIFAAFVIIAMMIFIPVMVNNTKAPVDTVLTDAAESGSESTSAAETEISGTESEVISDMQGNEAVPDITIEIEPDTEETEPDDDTETEQETTEAEPTVEESSEEAPATTKRPETEAEPDATTEEETEKEPETTKEEETTKRPETTAEPDTTEEQSAAATTRPRQTDPEKKYVAFTFDDGPHPENSKKITDKLLEYGGKGTFFVVGNLIYGEREEGMKYAYEHGMEIALHCWSHKWYYTKNPEKYHDEVYKGADAIKNSIGVWPTLMRPPGGNITDEQYKSCEFAVIIWDVDSNDWRYKSNKERSQRENIDIIVKNIMDEVKPGSIILMHEIYENSYLAFCEAIQKLADQGYEFVTVSELLNNPETGYKYYSANYKKG